MVDEAGAKLRSLMSQAHHSSCQFLQCLDRANADDDMVKIEEKLSGGMLTRTNSVVMSSSITGPSGPSYEAEFPGDNKVGEIMDASITPTAMATGPVDNKPTANDHRQGVFFYETERSLLMMQDKNSYTESFEKQLASTPMHVFLLKATIVWAYEPVPDYYHGIFVLDGNKEGVKDMIGPFKYTVRKFSIYYVNYILNFKDSW